MASDAVLRNDIQMRFLLSREFKLQDKQKAEVHRLLGQKPEGAAFKEATEQFCKSEFDQTQCQLALDKDSLLARIGNPSISCPDTLDLGCSARRDGRPLHQVLLWPSDEIAPSRPLLAGYMHAAGADGGLSLASDVSSNVSTDAAYVVSNIVRGLTGRMLFSADYALVVARDSSSDTTKRKTIESDRATLIRAINNGGTLVGRFAVPLYAFTGATGSLVTGVTLGGGMIGPVDDAHASDRHAAGSTSAEAGGVVAIRSLSGDATQTAELILRGRVGYMLSDFPLQVAGGFRDVSYFQGLVGIRQNGNLSVSALVTVPNHGFGALVPRLVLNFAATH